MFQVDKDLFVPAREHIVEALTNAITLTRTQLFFGASQKYRRNVMEAAVISLLEEGVIVQVYTDLPPTRKGSAPIRYAMKSRVTDSRDLLPDNLYTVEDVLEQTREL